MNYLSIAFPIFVAVIFLASICIPTAFKGPLLLLAGIFFYLSFDPRYFIFLLFVALSTFVSARMCVKTSYKKVILVLCVLANAAVWFAVKYVPWLLQKAITPAVYYTVFTAENAPLKLLVPVGISYFTLQALGYLADVYTGKIAPEKRFWKYLLFLSYFPAIVQGPISRYEQLSPQLLNRNRVSFDTVRSSLLLIVFGLVKKMVIADRLGLFVNHYFTHYNIYEGVILYIAAIAYSIQLYTDFSGCVDLCRGVSGLFGVNLIDNFNRPYFAKSIKEFWGRWHISLSSWLKDYIYIPLGGNRKGIARKYINLAIVFLVSGIWHGVGFNFILWGLLHAFYQIVGEHTMAQRNKIKSFIGIEPDSFSDRFYKTVITFHLVTFAWIFFRADSITAGCDFIAGMISQPALWELFDGTLYAHGMDQNFFTAIAVHICILFVLEKKFKTQEDLAKAILQQHLFLRWFIYLVLIFDVMLLGVYGSGYSAANFMYGGF